jgi:hypothetical protein
MREERDAALNALAVEREKANAILLSQRLPEPPPPKPIRYWAIDVINDALKRTLPLPQKGLRALIGSLRK